MLTALLARAMIKRESGPRRVRLPRHPAAHLGATIKAIIQNLTPPPEVPLPPPEDPASAGSSMATDESNPNPTSLKYRGFLLAPPVLAPGGEVHYRGFLFGNLSASYTPEVGESGADVADVGGPESDQIEGVDVHNVEQGQLNTLVIPVTATGLVQGSPFQVKADGISLLARTIDDNGNVIESSETCRIFVRLNSHAAPWLPMSFLQNAAGAQKSDAYAINQRVTSLWIFVQIATQDPVNQPLLILSLMKGIVLAGEFGTAGAPSSAAQGATAAAPAQAVASIGAAAPTPSAPTAAPTSGGGSTYIGPTSGGGFTSGGGGTQGRKI